MNFDWKSVWAAAVVLSAAFACDAQEREECEDEPYSEEICEAERPEGRCCRRHRDVFLNSHYYDNKNYQPLTPLPDWPGANNNLIDQLTR